PLHRDGPRPQRLPGRIARTRAQRGKDRGPDGAGTLSMTQSRAGFQGRVAIVTGAETGIGKAIAQRLAAEGAAVVLADIKDAEPVARELRAAGQRALAVRTDVADEQSVQALVEQTVAEFGRVDILVNNAAIAAKIELRP